MIICLLLLFNTLRAYDVSVLWCGFYFLGDKSDISEKYKDIVSVSIDDIKMDKVGLDI